MHILGEPALVTRVEWNSVRSHNFMITCSDGNYRLGHIEVIDAFGLDRPDKISWPGGAGALARSGRWFDMISEQVNFLNKEHQITKVCGVYHYDCGYYKLIMTGATEEDILEQQIEDARGFRKIMLEIAPKAFVKTLYECPWEGHVAYFNI